MASIAIDIELDRPVAEVWADLADIASHVTWMADAESIRFTTDQREGVGTTFDCVTRIGPFRLTDRMEVTEWEPEQVMGVEHRGVVRGTGRFTLTPRAGGRTRFGWEERLVFPWWLAGPAGAFVGRPILTAVWRRNLRRFGERIG